MTCHIASSGDHVNELRHGGRGGASHCFGDCHGIVMDTGTSHHGVHSSASDSRSGAGLAAE